MRTSVLARIDNRRLSQQRVPTEFLILLFQFLSHVLCVRSHRVIYEFYVMPLQRHLWQIRQFLYDGYLDLHLPFSAKSSLYMIINLSVEVIGLGDHFITDFFFFQLKLFKFHVYFAKIFYCCLPKIQKQHIFQIDVFF